MARDPVGLAFAGERPSLAYGAAMNRAPASAQGKGLPVGAGVNSKVPRLERGNLKGHAARPGGPALRAGALLPVDPGWFGLCRGVRRAR
jgi:hypothetical protein